ncbi:MAG: alpha/beta hydrolase [Anaerolineae bacterium]|nr:alpha/beta hydrolase [Anaerolineae bacterium]
MPHEPVTYTYRTVSGHPLRADVFRPIGAGPCPALLWLHGGALIFGSRKTVRPWQVRRYLEAGYAVVCPDYRLAPESKLPEIADDVLTAWAWTREGVPDLDPERLAVIGHSAGGYLALLLGTTTHPAPRAVVSFYGYGDIVADWYTRPDPHYLTFPRVTEEKARSLVGSAPISEGPPERFEFYLYCRQQGAWPQEVGGRDPKADAEFFRRYCPLRNVTSGASPTLLLHGDADTDVPYGQSLAMHQELARQGVETEMVTLEGGGHGFDRDGDDPHTLRAFDAVLDFLAAHLRP